MTVHRLKQIESALCLERTHLFSAINVAGVLAVTKAFSVARCSFGIAHPETSRARHCNAPQLRSSDNALLIFDLKCAEGNSMELGFLSSVLSYESDDKIGRW